MFEVGLIHGSGGDSIRAGLDPQEECLFIRHRLGSW